jgi:hypothetical protein
VTEKHTDRLGALAYYLDLGVAQIDAHLLGKTEMDDAEIDSLMLAMRRATSMVIDIAASASTTPLDRAAQLGIRVIDGEVKEGPHRN